MALHDCNRTFRKHKIEPFSLPSHQAHAVYVGAVEHCFLTADTTTIICYTKTCGNRISSRSHQKASDNAISLPFIACHPSPLYYCNALYNTFGGRRSLDCTLVERAVILRALHG